MPTCVVDVALFGGRFNLELRIQQPDWIPTSSFPHSPSFRSRIPVQMRSNVPTAAVIGVGTGECGLSAADLEFFGVFQGV